jgi:hypothetical protein
MSIRELLRQQLVESRRRTAIAEEQLAVLREVRGAVVAPPFIEPAIRMQMGGDTFTPRRDSGNRCS